VFTRVDSLKTTWIGDQFYNVGVWNVKQSFWQFQILRSDHVASKQFVSWCKSTRQVMSLRRNDPIARMTAKVKFVKPHTSPYSWDTLRESQYFFVSFSNGADSRRTMMKVIFLWNHKANECHTENARHGFLSTQHAIIHYERKRTVHAMLLCKISLQNEELQLAVYAAHQHGQNGMPVLSKDPPHTRNKWVNWLLWQVSALKHFTKDSICVVEPSVGNTAASALKRLFRSFFRKDLPTLVRLFPNTRRSKGTPSHLSCAQWNVSRNNKPV